MVNLLEQLFEQTTVLSSQVESSWQLVAKLVVLFPNELYMLRKQLLEL